MSVEAKVEELRSRLRVRTGGPGRDIRVVYSPLRVCPLGAHIDHQDGLVTGMTLNRVILLAFAPRSDGQIVVESENYAGRAAFSLDNVPPRIPGDWGNYVRGAVLALQQKHVLHLGMDALVAGEMPIGGLSSSAAVGVAYLLALEAVNGLEMEPVENIEYDRYIENTYLGLRNGILDPSIILMGNRHHLTYLDCQSTEFRNVPTLAPSGSFEVVVVHSGLYQTLVGTDYNNRVRECQMAARMLLEWAHEPVPEQPRLRMVTEATYEKFAGQLPSPLDRRARHFFTEIERVREGAKAWQAGDLQRVGQLMNESGASSVHDYQCGCPHLTTLYEILRECRGVYGARFSGGGFRGSCIALADPAFREEIAATVRARYPAVHPDIAEQYSIYFCQPDGPARLWDDGVPDAFPHVPAGQPMEATSVSDATMPTAHRGNGGRAVIPVSHNLADR